MNKTIEADKFAEGMVQSPIFDKNKGKWVFSYKKLDDNKLYTVEYDDLSSVCIAYGAKYTFYRNYYLNKLNIQR